jgi:hypothetical protein
VRTDSLEIITAAERAFGYWRVLEAHPELWSRERVEGRLVLRAGSEGSERPPVEHRVEGRRLRVSTRASECASDPDRREFAGRVTPELVASEDHFRYHVLEALVMSVVTWLDRTPVHASAVVRDGTALLLTGPSGRGKSTLTWAAAGAGFRILADDMVFVQLAPLRVWGMPAFLHLPEDSRRFFPELADAPVGLTSSGKEKIPLDLRARGVAAPFPVADRFGICVLDRRGPDVRWEGLSAAELGASMGKLDPGFDSFAEAYPELVARLAAAGGWRLEVGADPGAAARALGHLMDRVRGP